MGDVPERLVEWFDPRIVVDTAERLSTVAVADGFGTSIEADERLMRALA
jgi:hypothetical protein